LDEKAKEIFEWAKKKGALYYTFLCFPRSGGISEKQETFLNLNYFFSESSMNSAGNCYFNTSNLLKGEGDGSSFPSGGLR
jgi:glutamine synthetase